jgi:hypothetical protein
MSYAYEFQIASSGSNAKTAIAVYPNPATGEVTAGRALNCWTSDVEFVVVHQYDESDPSKPIDYTEPVTIATTGLIETGEYSELDLSEFGIIVASESSAFYGDEYLTCSGTGSRPAGGEVAFDMLDQ